MGLQNNNFTNKETALKAKRQQKGNSSRREELLSSRYGGKFPSSVNTINHRAKINTFNACIKNEFRQYRPWSIDYKT
jgi:hypothetical protein